MQHVLDRPFSPCTVPINSERKNRTPSTPMTNPTRLAVIIIKILTTAPIAHTCLYHHSLPYCTVPTNQNLEREKEVVSPFSLAIAMSRWFQAWWKEQQANPTQAVETWDRAKGRRRKIQVGSSRMDCVFLPMERRCTLTLSVSSILGGWGRGKIPDDP